MRRFNALALLTTGLSTLSGFAQIGVLDQLSPHELGANSASFNIGVDFLIWQQQIRCGLSGQLEGVRLTISQAIPEASFQVRIRMGPATSSNPILVDLPATRTVAEPETIFIDMTSANIFLNENDVFVMETQGHEDVWLIGSYVPPPGEPLYPEPLYLTGQLFVDDHWRHGFSTYMLTGGSDCPGDLDHDNQVGLSDLVILLSHFGTPDGATADDGDLDGDHDVDLSDLTAFLARFGTIC